MSWIVDSEMNCVFILLVRLWLWGYCGYCVLCLVGLERVYIFGFWWGRGCWCWCWFLMLHSGNGFSDFIQEVNSKWFLLIVIIVVGVFPFQKQQNQSYTPPPPRPLQSYDTCYEYVRAIRCTLSSDIYESPTYPKKPVTMQKRNTASGLRVFHVFIE